MVALSSGSCSRHTFARAIGRSSTGIADLLLRYLRPANPDKYLSGDQRPRDPGDAAGDRRNGGRAQVAEQNLVSMDRPPGGQEGCH
jgi:hypothetical protein